MWNTKRQRNVACILQIRTDPIPHHLRRHHPSATSDSFRSKLRFRWLRGHERIIVPSQVSTHKSSKKKMEYIALDRSWTVSDLYCTYLLLDKLEHFYFKPIFNQLVIDIRYKYSLKKFLSKEISSMQTYTYVYKIRINLIESK